MKKILLACALWLPGIALADTPMSCAFEKTQDLKLDFTGVRVVRFDAGSGNVDVQASARKDGEAKVRACTSSQAWLQGMKASAERKGDQLWVKLDFGNATSGSRSMGLGALKIERYARFELRAAVPDNVLVSVVLGSGDAKVTGAGAASADVGSGDATLSSIRGPVTANVSSGDIEIHGAGSLHVLGISSGDLTATDIRGMTKVDTIGSGDATISRTQGGVEVGNVGSGDITLKDIGGNISVNAIGSGDVELAGVRGDLTVRALGSGNVKHDGVTGKVTIPKKR